MNLKIEISFGQKKYFVNEPTVGLYRILLKDPLQFIEKLFGKKINLTGEQFTKLVDNLFVTKRNILDYLEKKEPEDNFHILVGQFMKFFGTTYGDVMNMPFSDFKKMLDDIQIISGEKKVEEKSKGKGPEIDKLKNLLSNIQ